MRASVLGPGVVKGNHGLSVWNRDYALLRSIGKRLGQVTEVSFHHSDLEVALKQQNPDFLINLY